MTSDRVVRFRDSYVGEMVTLTRVREALTLVVDQTGSVAGKIAGFTGEKVSALETTGKLDAKVDGRKPAPEKSLELTLAPGKPFEIGI